MHVKRSIITCARHSPGVVVSNFLVSRRQKSNSISVFVRINLIWSCWRWVYSICVDTDFLYSYWCWFCSVRDNITSVLSDHVVVTLFVLVLFGCMWSYRCFFICSNLLVVILLLISSWRYSTMILRHSCQYFFSGCVDDVFTLLMLMMFLIWLCWKYNWSDRSK